MTTFSDLSQHQRTSFASRMATMSQKDISNLSDEDYALGMSILKRRKAKVPELPSYIPYDSNLGLFDNTKNLASNFGMEVEELGKALTSGKIMAGLGTLATGGMQELGSKMFPFEGGKYSFTEDTPERQAFRKAGTDIKEGVEGFIESPGQTMFQAPLSTLLMAQPALGAARRAGGVIGAAASAGRLPANIAKGARGVGRGIKKGITGGAGIGGEILSGLKVSQQRQLYNRAAGSADEAAAIHQGLKKGRAQTPRARVKEGETFKTFETGPLIENEMIRSVIKSKELFAAEILKLQNRLSKARGTGRTGIGSLKERIKALEIGAKEFDQMLPTEGVSAAIGRFDDPLVQARQAAEKIASGKDPSRPVGNLAAIPDKLRSFGDDVNRVERGILEQVQSVSNIDLLSLATGFSASGVTSGSLLGKNIAAQGVRQGARAAVVGTIAIQPEMWPLLIAIPFTSPKNVAKTILAFAKGKRVINGIANQKYVKVVRDLMKNEGMAEFLNSGLSIAAVLEMHGIMPPDQPDQSVPVQDFTKMAPKDSEFGQADPAVAVPEIQMNRDNLGGPAGGQMLDETSPRVDRDAITQQYRDAIANQGGAEDFIGPRDVDPTQITIDIPDSSRIAFSHNNPGSITMPKSYNPGKGKGTGVYEGGVRGETSKDGKHTYVRYDTPELGYQAVKTQIQKDAARGLTLKAFITKFVGEEAKGSDYIQFIAKETGASPTTRISDIDLDILAQAMVRRESGTIITMPSIRTKMPFGHYGNRSNRGLLSGLK